MNGQEFLDSLSEEPTAERNRSTVEALSNGVLIVQWSEIVSQYKSHVAKFQVSTDAAYCLLEDGSRFRPQFSADMAQQAADIVGGCLPTSKLMDLRHQASNKLNANTLTASSLMSSTTYSKEWNKKVELKRAGYEGIVSDCGKAWLISNKLASSKGAVNYGFYHSAAPSVSQCGLKLYQSEGGMHNAQHLDYSQTLILIGATCEVNGQQMTIAELAKEPELSYLLNYSGKLNYTRGL